MKCCLMKTITFTLPDSVELSEAQIQDLVFAKIAEQQAAATLPPAGALAALVRPCYVG